MIDLPSSPTERFKTLHRFLWERFPSPKGEVISYPNETNYLLLRTGSELTAFALSTHDFKTSYEKTYDSFKQLYAANEDKWEKFNLNYVLCLESRSSESESFCTQIETNAYFCRKFVLSLDAEWASEFARLPFYPLENSPGSFAPPPSAQGLLRGFGVPAPLAAAIMGRVSEHKILDQCLQGSFGPANLTSTSVFDRANIAPPQTSLRIHTLEIENFRAYRGRQIFDLDADLVFIYGPNGFGKTSLFDAVDFAATGDIGRLNLTRNDQRFLKAASHLDEPESSGVVSIKIRAGEELHTLRRTVDDRHSALLNDVALDRKRVLHALTCPHLPPGSDQVDHLVKLFRATHLFSQEFQELTAHLRKECYLSTDVVSRLLAFEDYVIARKKLTKIIDYTASRLHAADSRIAELKELVAKDKASLEQHKSGPGSLGSPEALESLKSNLRASLVAKKVIAADKGNENHEVRGWRALIEAQISNLSAKLIKAQNLLALHPSIATKRKELKELKIRRTLKEEETQKEDTILTKLTENRTLAQNQLDAFSEREQLHQKESAKLVLAREHKLALEAQLLTENQLLHEIELEITAAKVQNGLVKQLNEERIAAEFTLKKSSNELSTRQKREAALNEVQRRLVNLDASWPREQFLENKLEELTSQFNSFETRKVQLNAELDLASYGHVALEKNLADLQRDQSGLEKLLSEIEAYISGGECPTCGFEYATKEELLSKMRSQKKVNTLASASTQLVRESLAKIGNLRRELAEIGSKRANIDSTGKAYDVELKRLRRERNDCEAAVRDIGFESSDPKLRDLIAASLNEVVRDSLQNSRDLLHAQERVSQLKKQLVAAQLESETLSKTLEAKSKQLTITRAEIVRTRERAFELKLPIELSTGDLTSRIDTSEKLAVEDAREFKSKLPFLNSEIQKQVDQSKLIAGLKLIVESTDAAVLSLTNEIETYQSGLLTAGVSSEADESKIQSRCKELSSSLSELETVKQRVLDLEKALDVGTMSAIHAEIGQRLTVAEAEVTKLLSSKNDDNQWLIYFAHLFQSVETTQTDIVSRYTQEYGPIASIIQKRLRAVTGFQDVELVPVGGNIEVKVRRGDERLLPIDFFSQSQQQILILSLFLTACATQNWSSFAPVLLDDPVTHFDDLNAYAFLDLINGLVGNESGARQFIISTCDERLFQLSRQRFHHLGARAKLYQFTSLDRDGPKISRL